MIYDPLLDGLNKEIESISKHNIIAVDRICRKMQTGKTNKEVLRLYIAMIKNNCRLVEDNIDELALAIGRRLDEEGATTTES